MLNIEDVNIGIMDWKDFMSINNYYYNQIERQITVVCYMTKRLLKLMIIGGNKKWKKAPDYEYNFI